jgi:hypothetical protein
MSFILLDGSQIIIEDSVYGNKKPNVVQISISNQLNVILSMQMFIHHNEWISEKGIAITLNPKKRYKFFIEDVDYSKDGSSHYISYKSEARNEKDGLYIDKTQPIYSSLSWLDSIIIWYKGTIVGSCFRKWAFLTYSTPEQCNGFFKSSEFAHYKSDCLHLVISPELSIPINSYYEKLWNIEEWKRYVFECQFGYDWWWGDPGYPQYAEYLYISWLITDVDFDPEIHSERLEYQNKGLD